MIVRRRQQIRFWLLAVMIGVSLALLLRLFVIAPVKVNGDSMNPNLIDQERVIALKQAKIKRFSVVAFKARGVVVGRPTNSLFVKRVIGLPGDTVKYTKGGQLYINGKLKKQAFTSEYQRQQGTTQAMGQRNFDLKDAAIRYSWQNKWSRNFKDNYSSRIPKNCYFVLGDNRDVSYDSRRWGFVPHTKIVGVVKAGPWYSRAEAINDYAE